MSDLISKRDALDAVLNLNINIEHRVSWLDAVVDAIDELPSAQPEERPRGRMSDYISRRDALDAMCDNCDTVQAVCAHFPCARYIAVEKLPAVEDRASGRNKGVSETEFERKLP